MKNMFNQIETEYHDTVAEYAAPVNDFNRWCMYMVSALVAVMFIVGNVASIWPWTTVLVPLSTVLAYAVVCWRRNVTMDQLDINITVAKLMGYDVDWMHDVVDDVSRSTMAVDYKHALALTVSCCCVLDFINTVNPGHLVGVCTPCVLITLQFIVIGQRVKLQVYHEALDRMLKEALDI